jgi:hypothetical protein
VGALDTVGRPLISAVNDRNFWLDMLDDLNERLPADDIWITELVAMSGDKPVGAEEQRVPQITPNPLPARSARKPGEATGPAIDAILLRGLYLFNPKQEQVVVDYFKNLVDSRFFAIDPREQARVIKSSLPNNTEWAFSYELRLDLRTPFKLP